MQESIIFPNIILKPLDIFKDLERAHSNSDACCHHGRYNAPHMRQDEVESHRAKVSKTVLGAHFVFTLWDILSGYFGKKLNSGVQFKGLLYTQESFFVLPCDVLIFQMMYSFSCLPFFRKRALRYRGWADLRLVINPDTSHPSFQCSFKAFFMFRTSPQLVP